MAKATGTFEVTTGGEEPYEELDGGIKLTHASGKQMFSGDIAGDGVIHWLMLYRSDKTAQFVGMQRITGSVDGRRGTFVLAADGEHDGTASRVSWTVVPNSGSGELAGMRGKGTLVAPGGRHGIYELEYELES
jgi:Protein of unknown function (DUF3224)